MACWKSVVGFENYEVSNEGFVRSVRTGRVLNPKINNGYRQVNLYKGGGAKPSMRLVHRLVAIAFIPNPDDKSFVDHVFGVAAGDMVKNLRWATRTENGQNRCINKNNKTGFKGVTFNKRTQKYEAHIRLNGKQTYLGSFNTAAEGYAAYCLAATEKFGAYAKMG